MDGTVQPCSWALQGSVTSAPQPASATRVVRSAAPSGRGRTRHTAPAPASGSAQAFLMEGARCLRMSTTSRRVLRRACAGCSEHPPFCWAEAPGAAERSGGRQAEPLRQQPHTPGDRALPARAGTGGPGRWCAGRGEESPQMSHQWVRQGHRSSGWCLGPWGDRAPSPASGSWSPSRYPNPLSSPPAPAT